jgi:hypothetical protein
MKRTFSLLAVFFMSLALFAQSAPSLDQVLNSLTSRKVTEGSFTMQKTSAKLKRPLTSSGTYIMSDKGIVWNTIKPFPQTMAVTEDAMIQIRPDGTKNVVDGSGNEIFKTVASSVKSIFGSSREGIEKSFNIKNFTSDKSTWNLTLVPKDSTIAGALNSIELGGSWKGSDCSLDKTVIVQGESNSTAYTYSNQVYKDALSESQLEYFKK